MIDATDVNIALDQAFSRPMRNLVGDQEWERRLDEAAYAAVRILDPEGGQ